MAAKTIKTTFIEIPDRAALLDQLELANPEALTADGLEDALIGIMERSGTPSVAAYSVQKIIEIYMTRDGMTYEEGREFYEYNVLGSCMGDNGPVFIET